jgi:hypothetical protein
MKRKKEEMRERKAQEEMVGFVLIIVLVAVIALVFLAISIRKPQETKTSKEIENFLHSSLLYTASCQSSPERIYDFRDLIEACLKSERCLSGEKACDVLNKTAFDLIEASFHVGEEERYKGYIFKIYRQNETLVYLSRSKQTSTKLGSEVPVYISGNNFYIRLEIFY